MSRIISVLLLLVATTVGFAAEPIKLVDNVPDRHIVVPGDTLWGIAGKFLQEPWRWPEIWRMNKADIRNPNRIYPGDIVLLDLSEGEPRLRIAKPVKLEPQIYTTPVREEIPAIPPRVIEPFLSQPLVVGAAELDTSPRIVAAQDDRVIMGGGDKAFVMGVAEAENIVQNWQLFRPGGPLIDPDTKEILGYEAMFLGVARLLEAGEPALVELVSTKGEVTVGDRLVPAPPVDLTAYVPRKPDMDVSGRIIALYGGVGEGGRFSIVSINRGALEGLEPGHVVALYRKRDTRFEDSRGRSSTLALPERRYGLAFVFRTFDRVSYALVMESDGSVVTGDAVRNP